MLWPILDVIHILLFIYLITLLFYFLELWMHRCYGAEVIIYLYVIKVLNVILLNFILNVINAS